MSIKSQQQNMKTIYSLVSGDLGYIYGEQCLKDIGARNASAARPRKAGSMSESGPNGAKKQYLTKSAAFLRAIGNDLGFEEFKVTTNPGGIAASGDVTLKGMWSESNGLYFQINQPLQPFNSFLFRSINHLKDYNGGSNQWLPCDLFATGDYEKLIDVLSALRKPSRVVRHAA